MPASLDDILTSLQQLVKVTSSQVSNATNLAGAQDFYNITTATLIKSGAGRIVNLVAIVAGSSAGTVYDAQTVSDTTRPIFTISTTGIVVVNMPFQYGLLIVPGSGQTLAGSYS